MGDGDTVFCALGTGIVGCIGLMNGGGWASPDPIGLVGAFDGVGGCTCWGGSG